MVLANMEMRDPPNREHVTSLILKECMLRRYSGVYADFTEPCPFLRALFPFLSSELRRLRLSFFSPEWCSESVRDCDVVCSTAITGGSLQHRLKNLIQAFGSEHIVLDLEMLSHDFLLPAAGGTGQKISAKRIHELMDFHHLSPQFSSELCCNYFSYRNQQGLHFVLFDDSCSVAEKIKLSQKLGLTKCILLYPEADASMIKAAISFDQRPELL
jgi:hypothetical protein